MRSVSSVCLVLLSCSLFASCQTGSDALLDSLTEIDSQGRFLVSPRWSPGGERLLLSGRGGVGLYVVQLDTGKIDELDPAFRGAARWDAAGDITHSFAGLDDGSQLLYSDDGIRVSFSDYRGRLIVSRRDMSRVLAEDAWGATVAPDGGMVAYCTGHLPVAELHVVRIDGTLEYSGPGAQPEWLPDDRRLVFTRPQAADDGGTDNGIVGADLFMLDLATHETRRLTATPKITEMQPAISPSGKLAFTDWRSGRLFVAKLALPGGGS
ncbi:MAG TPA: hypothetical protein VM425_20280 [Myxococcota bacterium]|nr:hypothetical protein [Myxococcota bacterium]